MKVKYYIILVLVFISLLALVLAIPSVFDLNTNNLVTSNK
jgi:hypothetical protein